MNFIKFYFLIVAIKLTFNSCLLDNKRPNNATRSNKENHKIQYRIARPTTNLDTILKFYTKALNLKKLYDFKDHDGFDGIIIGLPGEEYHLEFVYHKQFTPNETKAPSKENLLVFYYDNMSQYEEAIKRMEDYGAKIVEPDNPYWMGKSKTYEDPDGWRIVLFKSRNN